jgi:hypothetical protein
LTARIPSVLDSSAESTESAHVVAVRAEERQHETLQAARVLMVVATARTVVVTRPRIVCVTVIVIDRRVPVAGVTTVGVGVSHVCQLSITVCLWFECRGGGAGSWPCSARYQVPDPVEPWTPDLDLGTEASGATPSST